VWDGGAIPGNVLLQLLEATLFLAGQVVDEVGVKYLLPFQFLVQFLG